ncbi:MAG: tRNA 2-thiouridine(34) synthase MnmA [Deltaproteobacteria bacterium]|jgi:tRNA-uridine 2-sulfurtransferase|nr:tRNA 2-thiouridine(34) synthase MnmA [Deltaproteobacteria bacterium]MBT6435170.1 tRNA 2-thiouridine(34) synthase MnmA [Deltaproteobacteria bacterium]MBT6491651.1 tRNA 2-thiouridine(34) synthase MnmA [Deltaproteobacteria bacterium]
MRVVVAMSGGVDSSAVAGLLKEQGHEVIGLAMKTHSLQPKANRACCTPDDMRDARLVADMLDIPFYVLPYEETFKELVIKPFAEAYRDGYTPNPCVVCNDKVKFMPLLERAQLLGADALATGHYARIEGQPGNLQLKRGLDSNKDQSYFLYRLRQDQLSRLMFPIGNMNKAEVREHARRFGMPLADKHESQEICFVGKEGYAATVEKILGEGGRAGNFVTTDGAVLGKHPGVHHFTIGQRRGLGIAAPKPLYVLDVDGQSGDVTVGTVDELSADWIDIEDVVWTDGHQPRADAMYAVQQRYRSKPNVTRVEITGERTARLHFAKSEQPGAPGQAAVIYADDTVVGGGKIAKGRFAASRRKSLPVIGQMVQS